MDTFTSWQDYAIGTVRQALASQEVENNYPASLAALALINIEWERGHPSYHNTQFAVGAFLLPGTFSALRLPAWRMVVNGLAGYWQWQSHNGASFSVTKALVHLGLLTKEEALDTGQFNVRATNAECGYFVIIPDLLGRLVEMFDLLTTNQSIGGETVLSDREIRERESMKASCPTGGIASEGRFRYEHALRSM